MIANNINKVLKSTSDNTRLAFPSIIQRLCDEAGVEKIIDEVLVKQDKFITAKKMAKVMAVYPLNRARERRAHAHEPQQQEEEEAEEQPQFLALQPPPQYQYQQFPEGFNWEQLQGDVHQMKGDLHYLREDVNQLKKTRQQQWSQINQNIQQLQGNWEHMRKEQQEQFDWGEVRSALDKIVERQYDINTQAKLNHLCNAVAALNPGYPTFMQGMEELSARQEEIPAKHKEDERNYMRRAGFWKPKDAKAQEGSSKPDEGCASPSKKKDKGKGPMN
ncbi:uncharacterized protein DS421_14g463680 [Arachis hypogaea]|nr:uncharacterized protein DS421_14g463680 [Arachis hypogaea]